MKLLAAYPLSGNESDWDTIPTLTEDNRKVLKDLDKSDFDIGERQINYLNGLNEKYFYEFNFDASWIRLYECSEKELKEKRNEAMRKDMKFNKAVIYMPNEDFPLKLSIVYYWFYPRIGLMKVIDTTGTSYMCSRDRILLINEPE